METREIRMDGDTSAGPSSFGQDARVGVHDPLRANVLCVSSSHYCKSIVDVLQALCFLLTATVKWLYYGPLTPSNVHDAPRGLAHGGEVQSADCVRGSLSFWSAKVDAIVTNIAGA